MEIATNQRALQDLAPNFVQVRTSPEGSRADEGFLPVDKTFPRGEEDALSDQIRRSPREGVGMNAARWGRRSDEAVDIHQTTVAMGEAMETQSCLDDALGRPALDREWRCIDGMLNPMIERSADLCMSARAR